MKERRFQTFDEFWPYYVREHSKKANRTLHFVGTSAAMACLAGGLLLRRPLLLALAPLAGYGPAWIGHFFVEKNRPATFDYPLWSLQADFRMWAMTLAGAMDAEVERVTASNGYHERASTDEALRSVLADEARARCGRESMN